MAGVAPRARVGSTTTISSRQNSSVQRYRTLAREHAQDDQERRLLLEGLHLLKEARAAGLAIDSAAFAREMLASSDVQALARTLADAGAEVFAVSDSVLAAMSPARTPSGVVAIALRPPSSIASMLVRAPQLVVVATDVQDPGNVGAIVRAAEAAGATGVVACGSSADPFGWKALRGSMGSAFRLPVARGSLDAAISACRAASLQVLAATPRDGRAFFEVNLTRPCALVFGGEGPGLPEQVLARADARVSIPMQRPVESLNVAVAAALLLYEAYRQRSVRHTQRL